MKIHALSNLLSMQKDQCKQVASIDVSAFLDKPVKGISRFKEKLLNFIFQRQSKYQIICAQLAQLSNLKEFKLCLEFLNALSDKEFYEFNGALANFNSLQDIVLIVNASINSHKIRKRLTILAPTLASKTKVKNFKLHYILRYSESSFKLWQDLWAVTGLFKDIERLYFNCDTLEVINFAQWQFAGLALSKYRKLQFIYLKARGLAKLSNEQLSALGDALAQAQTLQAIQFEVNMGNSTRAQRLILGIALAKLPRLQYLDLSANNILVGALSIKQWHKVGPVLKKLINLKKLNVAENNFGLFSAQQWQELGASWASLMQLEILDLSHNNLGSMDFLQLQALGESLAKLHALKSINLSDNKFGDMEEDTWEAFLKVLEKLQSLEYLALSLTNLGDLSVGRWGDLGRVLANLPKLPKLDLSHNELGDMLQKKWKAFIVALRQITNLREINVNYNELSNEQLMQITKETSPRMQKILFSNLGFRGKIINESRYEIFYSGLRFNFKPNELIKVEHPEYLACSKQKMQGFSDKIFVSLPLDDTSVKKVEKSLISLLPTEDICILREVCKPKLGLK